MKNAFRHTPLSFLLSFFILCLVSCSHKIGFQPSSVAPAARGEVKVNKDKNNNYAIDLDVQMLAEPNRLAQPRSAYIVWADTEHGMQKLGQLKTDDGLFSKKLKASMKTTTPYKPRRIFITAEDNTAVRFPGNYVVLTTDSF